MKYSPSIISKLRDRLQQPLPGLDIQMEMAPQVRGREITIPSNARKSAILALLYPHAEELYLAFMKRAEDGRVHSGQICFPGGGREESDVDFTHTALRETEEEMGIPAREMEVIGALTELYIPPSNSLVFPRVGFMPQRPSFNPDPKEVAMVLETPVSHLMDPEIIGNHRVDVFQGMFIQAPGYTIHNQHLIWGATAMMIAELLYIFNELK